MVTQHKSKERQMNELEKFKKEKIENINKQYEQRELGYDFIKKTAGTNYTYNFSWLGRPIIQMPQDIVAIQELIWKTKPDLIIETGIAHGGSLIFSASMLTLLEACGEIKNGKVLGVDIDIREHNKKLIQDHPMMKKITMIEGSSISEKIVEQVKNYADKYKNIMVVLDSNHTHDHVLSELEIYGPLVTKNNYCIVMDTIVEEMPKNSYPNRPWDVGNNPKTAIKKYLEKHSEFEIDEDVQNKILITSSPDGYLKKIK